ncbi:putative ribonuclease H-like domain-containing protein [Tanacetum coccineum]|uniref:Ribonuclease H-like domain-containing protein n=1 Tax=Tanacetum coccineum TaxID=301880 RepID=A0ABQ4Z3E6_9ASTR
MSILSPKFKFIDTEDLVILRAPRKNDVYSLDLKNIIPSGGITCLVAKATEDEAVLWHRRLGHVNFKNINKLVKDNLVRGLPSKTFKLDHSCVACRKGKQHRASCKKIEERTVREPLELLHMDLFGPVSVESINKKKYCLVAKTIEVKTTGCDHGTEFKNQLMNEFCAKKEIKREYTLPELTQKVLQKERIGLLLKAARHTPYEILMGRSPNISFMRPFGCSLTILNTLDHLGKFDASEDGYFGIHYYQYRTLPKLINEDQRMLFVRGKEENIYLQKKITCDQYFHSKYRLIPPPQSTGNTPTDSMIYPTDGVFSTNSFDAEEGGKEPKKVSQAIANECWVEAMQEEVFNSKLQRFEAIRLFLAFASFMGFTVYQMDVKSAFCMATSQHEACIKPQSMLMISSLDLPVSMVKDFEDLMQKEFKMSSMGELTFFLGLQVKQSNGGIFLSQDKYVKDILNKFDFRTIKPASTPIEAHKSLGKDEEGEDVDVHLYRSMIGCLMYLTASRPDIMFAVCLCARFQVTPKVSHLHAVKRIFRYLKHQPNLGLWYPKDSPFHLEAFSDSDYAGTNHDEKINFQELSISWQKTSFLAMQETNNCGYLLYRSRICSSCKLLCSDVEKTAQNADFYQIIDFLTGCSINYSLLVDPDLIGPWLQQFWATATLKQPRADTTLDYENGVDCFPEANYIGRCSRYSTGDARHISNVHLFLVSKVRSFVFEQAVSGIDRLMTLIPSVSLPSKVFTFMRKHSTKFSCRITPLTPSMLEVVTALAAEEEQSTSPHSRATIQGTGFLSDTVNSQGTAEIQRTADFQGTADPHDAASIPKSPNDYTPTDVSQTSGGDEGLLDTYALNREVRRLKKQTLSQAKQILKLKAKLKKLAQGSRRRFSTSFLDDTAIMMSCCYSWIWKEKSDETEEIIFEEKEASKILNFEEKQDLQAHFNQEVEHSGPYKLNLNSQHKPWKATNDEELLDKFKLSGLQKKKKEKELYDKVQASIKDSFKDFIPMDSEKERETLKEREAKRLLRKRKATISEEQPSKKPKLRTETIDELRNYLRVVDFEKSVHDKESLEGISMITELQVIDSPDGEYLIIHRENNHFRAFDTLWEILHVLDRQDLYHLYRVVDDYYEHIPPTGLGLMLLGDLNIIWETAESSDDDFWKDQEEWEIIRWRFHESSGVHTLEIEDGTNIHMLADRKISS